MIKNGWLWEPYKGIEDCFGRIINNEGVRGLWRGNNANIIRYLPSQFLTVGLYHEYKGNCDNHFVANLATGVVAGSSSLMLVYSLNCIRTHLASDISQSRQFRGWTDVYSRIGFTGTYRGIGTSLAGAAVYRGLCFGLYDSLRPRLADRDNFFTSFLLGWGVVTAAGLASYPIDTVRRRMMMTSRMYPQDGPFGTIERIIKKEGVKSLYNGAGANVLRGVAGAFMLALYDKHESTSLKCCAS